MIELANHKLSDETCKPLYNLPKNIKDRIEKQKAIEINPDYANAKEALDLAKQLEAQQ